MAVSVYQQGGFGTAPLFPSPIISQRDPTTTDRVSPSGQPYQIFQGWNNELTDDNFLYLGAGNWVTIASVVGSINQITSDAGVVLPAAGNINIVGGSGVATSGVGATLTISLTGGGTAIDSFVPDAGTNPVVPTAAGAVTMAGTANQITTTGGLNTLTFSVPATFVAPGTITATTSVTSPLYLAPAATDMGITATAGQDIDVTLGDAVGANNLSFFSSTPALIASLDSLGNMTALAFITSSATLGTTYTDNSITPTGSDANISLLVNGKGTGGIIHSRSAAGVDINFQATNGDNTNNASHASFQTAVGGTSAGDPYFQSLISGGQVFSWGIDNSSANDDFVISNSAALGTSNAVVIDGSSLAFSSTSSITAATSLTATLGDITATNGNLVLGTAGNKINITTGANASAGVSANLSGTPGTITILTTAVTTSSLIFISRNTPGGTLGNLSVPSASIVNGASFVIDSDANETSTVNWWIIN